MNVVGFHRNTVATIDLAAIRHNVLEQIKQLNTTQEVFVAVKANGYGHGIVEVAYACKEAGATGFCVAILDEALELRKAGITDPIIVLGISRPQDVKLLLKHRISTTISSLDWLQEALKYLDNELIFEPLLLHLKVDTGMGRLGILTVEQARTIEKFIQSHNQLFYLEGVYTHFAKADVADTQHADMQLERFKSIVASMEKPPKYVHCSNSAWALWHDTSVTTIVRLGIATYGINPSNGDLEVPRNLKPALRLDSEIVQIKQLPAGSTVSYGATYTCLQDEWIATIPIGYGDGWARHYNRTSVLVDGQRCPIVGRICMDQMMVRLPEYKPVGTRVTLIGKNGTDEMTAEEVSQLSHTIAYEVVTMLSHRIPRNYINGNQ